MINVKVLKPFDRHAVGDKFAMQERFFRVLGPLGYVEEDKRKTAAQAKAAKSETDSETNETPPPVKKTRTYKRKDMQAEGE